MAKPVRGLPADFSLDLPDEDRPVSIGDFLDEAPPIHVVRRAPKPEPSITPENSGVEQFTHREVPERIEREPQELQSRPVLKKAQPSKIIRYQLNLNPRTNTMFEELIEHVRTYSPENDARASEVFQGVIGLLHAAMDELDLAELPRRGAWGSVTAKNFPGALSQTFEKAVLRAARKRGVG
jgi:hypothetical protein